METRSPPPTPGGGGGEGKGPYLSPVPDPFGSAAVKGGPSKWEGGALPKGATRSCGEVARVISGSQRDITLRLSQRPFRPRNGQQTLCVSRLIVTQWTS